MIFTLPGLSRSLADCLAPDLPGVRFFADPAQQGAKPPMLFLRQTNARVAKKMGERFLRRLGLDLVYLERLNIPDGDSRLQAAADVMDQRLETFPYRGGGERPVREPRDLRRLGVALGAGLLPLRLPDDQEQPYEHYRQQAQL